jgi:hypothetical protein
MEQEGRDMSKLKRCPFCGEMLERKHIRKTKYGNGYDYYAHTDNECFLARANDMVPVKVFDNDVDDWNRRAKWAN